MSEFERNGKINVRKTLNNRTCLMLVMLRNHKTLIQWDRYLSILSARNLKAQTWLLSRGSIRRTNDKIIQ